mmetsp:Transcript_23949/g.75313  ORF Transcript_23949/g.75313 Transcript_23949/m.75313 type:complete len:354 (-) Transcript_23949:74-1135(-)
MSILGMGNPLLDISAEVDTKMLEKYGLQLNNAILAEEKHQPLFAEMAAMPGVQYIAGGATQNSIRVAQWMLQAPGSTAYIGCTGSDDFAKKMRSACEKDGVKTAYMVDSSTPTGCCAVLVNSSERSLCTNLNAANNYKVEHLQKPEVWKLVKEASIIYSAGFFITVSPPAMRLAAKEAADHGALYCLNLAAPFLMQVPPFKAVLTELLPQVDILFGNETEAQTWAETEGWETKDVPFIATRLSLIPSSKPSRKRDAAGGALPRKRVVVITQGADPTIVAVNGHVTQHPVLKIPKEKLVDTNGAGDAFVGGFLAALSKGLPMDACCKAGAYSASVVVQNSGCTYPDKPQYSWKN